MVCFVPMTIVRFSEEVCNLNPSLGIRNLLFLFVVVMTLAACGGGGGETSTSSQPPGPGPITASVTLGWDQVTTNADGSPCNDLGGYRIYYGTSPGITRTNSLKVDIGNRLSAEIGNLTIGVTYYFRISSYDINGNESELSVDDLPHST